MDSGTTRPRGKTWVASASYGNGLTNARTYLQGLIDRAEAAGGGIIDLPPGTFIIGSPAAASEGGLRFKTATPNVWLRGAGMGRTILKVADNISVAMTGIIRTTSGLAQANVKVSDLTLDGNRANNTLTTIAWFSGVSPYTQCDIAISGTTATLSNFGGTGAAHGITNGATIAIDSWTQVGLRGDYVANVINATSLSVTVISGLSTEAAVPMYKTSFANSEDTNIVLENVEAKNCKNGGTGGYGFDPHERCRNIHFRNCVAHDNDGPGIALDGCLDFTVDILSYNNQGEAAACYTRTRDGYIRVRGYGNGNNNGGAALSSMGFEGSATNISADVNLSDGYGNGSTIAFGSSGIRLRGMLENMQNHGVQVRGASDCTIDVTVVDAGQAATNSYDAVYLDGGQATNQRNHVAGLVVRSRRTNKMRYGVNVGSSAVLDATIGPDLDIPYAAVSSGQIENVGTRTKISSLRTAAGEHPGYVSARWYPPIRTGAYTTLLTVANRAYFIPFFVPAGARINRFAIEETTGGSATATYRLGIYTAGKGQPSELVVDLGQLSVTATIGQKTLNPADIRLEGGWYFLCLVGNGAVTMPTLSAQNVDVSGRGAAFYGLASPLDIDDATLTPSGWFYDDAGVTYVSSGLPSAAPSVSAIVNAASPLCFFEAG